MNKKRDNYWGEGIVEDNNDPLKIGRVKLRDPNEETPEKTPTESLEWYYPCLPFFGGPDFGSISIPPIGTYVWYFIQYVDLNSEPRRVYVGGSGYGTGTTVDKEVGGITYGANKLETPQELQVDYPNTKILCKTQDGSVVYLNSSGDIILKNKSGATCQLNNTIILTKQVGESQCLIWADENEINIISNNKSIKLNSSGIIALLESTSITMTTDMIDFKAKTVNIDCDNFLVQGNGWFKKNVNIDKDVTVLGKTNLEQTTTIQGIEFMRHTHQYTDWNNGEGAEGGDDNFNTEGVNH